MMTLWSILFAAVLVLVVYVEIRIGLFDLALKDAKAKIEKLERKNKDE